MSYISIGYEYFHRVMDNGGDWKSVCTVSEVHAVPIFGLTRGVASEQIWPNKAGGTFGASMRRAVM
jgi:hypothetical protein